MKDPVEAGMTLVQRFQPERLVHRFAQACATAGLKRPAFILSFDCDTDDDIGVGWDVHRRLVETGIRPVYAVPGENLERGSELWSRIAGTGSEFLNHGYREHTVRRGGRYVSTVFYHQLSRSQIKDDIVRGHDMVTKIIGRTPHGFRTPHFGLFASTTDLRFLHSVLQKMNYRFSTSTLPKVALRSGPFTQRYGITELPVTGCPDYPLAVLDSYSFRFAGNGLGAEGYIAQMKIWFELLERGTPLFINIYADPSQVADWPEFFTVVAKMAPFARTSYDDILDEVGAP
jgi:hypothetical protein